MADDAGFATGWRSLEPRAGRLLVAAPRLQDPSFRRSVVYLLDHDDGGSFGVVINRPTHTPVGQVLPDWHEVVSEPSVVYSGGPVQPDGALCLGRLSGSGSGVRPLVGELCTVDLESEVGQITTITNRLRVFAGHSGWAAGQLSAELAEGAWFVLDALSEDVFSQTPSQLWARVLRRQPMPLRLLANYPDNPSAN